MKNERQIYASFCGTGKTTYTKDNLYKSIDLESYKYHGNKFPNNYIEDILDVMQIYDVIFISTDARVLKELHNLGIKVTIVYPSSDLKDEYFKRFRDRNSHIDFINTLEKYWYKWINEIKNSNLHEKIVLKSGMFISDIIRNDK